MSDDWRERLGHAVLYANERGVSADEIIAEVRDVLDAIYEDES